MNPATDMMLTIRCPDFMVQVLTTVQQIRELVRPTLVPTMGALHAGHLSLIRRGVELSRSVGGCVIASIFVNPTQFGPGEDFASYPRSLDADVAQAADAGAECVFAPTAETMYPPDEPVTIPPLPAVATEPGLEDARRPDHFSGVCQVVARLFDVVRPRFAVFGLKDYQQLCVVQQMVHHQQKASEDRWPQLEVVAGPTVREPDGLAMSSRNAYLSPGERKSAVSLHRALQAASDLLIPQQAEQLMLATLIEHGLEVDYACVRDARTLMPVESNSPGPWRALIAARIGSTRLIDNGPMNGGGAS